MWRWLLELESIQSGSRNSDFSSNNKEDNAPDDTKVAFQSVLQGLVGFLNATPVIPSEIPIYKIASLEIKEKQSFKEESVKVEQDSTNNKNAKDNAKDIDSGEAEVFESHSEEPKSKSEDLRRGRIEDTVKKDTVKKDTVKKDTESKASNTIEQETEVVESNLNKHKELSSEDIQNKVSDKVVAKPDQEDLHAKETVDSSTSNIKSRVNSDTSTRNEGEVSQAKPTLDGTKPETDSEQVATVANFEDVGPKPDVSSNAKEAIKVLNSKPIRSEGRTLEDEIEISYYEARDLFAKEMKLGAENSTLKPENVAIPVSRDLMGSKALTELIKQSSLMMSQGFLESSSSNIFRKTQDDHFDINQSLVQGNKTVFDKGHTGKITNESFSARTAQAQVMIDKVKAVLEQATVNKANDTITVKVEPANLGELTVKVSEKNGQIYAKITPQSREVEDILRSQSRELSLVIQALGYQKEDVQISIGEASPDFHSAFYNGNDSQGESSGSNKGSQNARTFLGNGIKDTGMKIDNNLTREDLVGWIA